MNRLHQSIEYQSLDIWGTSQCTDPLENRVLILRYSSPSTITREHKDSREEIARIDGEDWKSRWKGVYEGVQAVASSWIYRLSKRGKSIKLVCPSVPTTCCKLHTSLILFYVDLLNTKWIIFYLFKIWIISTGVGKTFYRWKRQTW